MSGALPIEANLTGAQMAGADLTDADLSYAKLSKADLSGAYLTGADLDRTDLTGADFKPCLAKRQLDQACGIPAMLLAGFKPPKPCTAVARVG